jgi:hypothetical protein
MKRDLDEPFSLRGLYTVCVFAGVTLALVRYAAAECANEPGRVDCGYLPAAHTGGDLFVHLPELKVLAAERLAGLVKLDTRVVPPDGRTLTGG